jgi:hypothetical protein
MYLSAEVRWFWHDTCPQPLHDWFFRAELPPGGGAPRIDQYLHLPGQAEVGIKERGDALGLEIKGLVARRESAALGAVTPHVELWCKWSCAIPELKFAKSSTLTKIRWLRKFDTSAPDRVEIPLDPHEGPAHGHRLPAEGCSVELTEVRVSGRPDAWWTLGYEAFGTLETVALNLTRGVLPDMSILAGIVWSSALLSYPGWLSARLAE